MPTVSALIDAHCGLKLVHITDLHFGMPGQAETWRSLANHLQQVVKPDLVLVTGDIVDDPDPGMFTAARDALDGLNIPYRVCAGNHDRFWKGNRGRRFFIFGLKNADTAFDNVFQGRVALPTEVSTFPLRGWKVGVLGVDSSERADVSARGFVHPDRLDELRQRDFTDLDLVILMIHHHPLPVRELEFERRGTFGDLANLLCLVNAGTLLECASEIRVDVILHGHEHAANTASYGSLRDAQWRVAIVGGDSSTGAHTWSGCGLNRAGYNLLLAEPDGALDLHRVRNRGGGWEIDSTTPIRTSFAARRSRVIRQNKNLAGVVDSEVCKQAALTETRDMRITHTYSNWYLEDTFHFYCENSTGRPDHMSLLIRSGDGQQINIGGEFARVPGQSHRWAFSSEVPSFLRERRVNVVVSYVIVGGALLTDWDRQAAHAELVDGFLRSEGFEYTSVQTHDALAAVELLLDIPEQFQPERVELRVYDLQEDTWTRVESEEADLHLGCFRELGAGNFLLRVPYPRGDRLYVLAWKPIMGALSPTGSLFRDACLARGQETLKQILSRLPMPGSASASLHLRAANGELQECARVSFGSAPTTRPDSHSRPRGDVAILGQAGWGVTCLIGAPPFEEEGRVRLGIMPQELRALTIPVRVGLDVSGDPTGVVRIGAYDDAAASVLTLDVVIRTWGPALSQLTATIFGGDKRSVPPILE